VRRNLDDPRPEYAQIADDLRSAVTSGRLKTGDKLLSRSKLAEQYGVATATVNRAVEQLVREGVVVAWNRGTFVRRVPGDTDAEPSPEYLKIMSVLEAIRGDLDQLDSRIARLEGLVGEAGHGDS
jgi:DNA-binding GntR family transcriptional regulator